MKTLTPFQIKVYKALLAIPAGETRTYKQIAVAIGKPKAARAVGNACNQNPYAPMVPCHRVVGSNGKLTGFALGLKVKEDMLAAEQKKKSATNIYRNAAEKQKREFFLKLPTELR